jgi:transposase InsO family protein
VRYLVKQLKALLPGMGKVRIAQILARAGLHLSATTVGRMLRESDPPPAVAIVPELDVVPTRAITATYPGHTWHVDLTTVPTGTGFWVPWLPFTTPQAWPFCWWIAVVVDHYSRVVIGFAVFFDCPASSDIQESLSLAIHRVGRPPKYIISDKGRQFWCESFKRWCRHRGIHPRFGAVGEHGSIAIVERFIRSIKSECTRRLLVPLRLGAMRDELTCYVVWYNEHRPSQALGGRTPWEVYADLRPANAEPRFEPRPNWRAGGSCTSSPTVLRGTRGTELALVVGYVESKKHLPVVGLRQAA